MAIDCIKSTLIPPIQDDGTGALNIWMNDTQFHTYFSTERRSVSKAMIEALAKNIIHEKIKHEIDAAVIEEWNKAIIDIELRDWFLYECGGVFLGHSHAAHPDNDDIYPYDHYKTTIIFFNTRDMMTFRLTWL